MLYAGRRKKNKKQTRDKRRDCSSCSPACSSFPPNVFLQADKTVCALRPYCLDRCWSENRAEAGVFGSVCVCVWEVNVLLRMKTERDQTRDPAVLARTDKCTWTDGRAHAPLCCCPSHFQLSVLPWEVKDMKSTVPASRGQPFSPPFCGPLCPPHPLLVQLV